MWHSLPPSASFWPDVGRFWDTLQNECTAPRWVVSAPSSPILGRCWSCWAMLGQRWDRIALILSHFGPHWSKDVRQTWQEVSQHSSSQRSKDTRRACESSRDTLWHSSKATNWDTHQTVVQVSQHSSKQRWQEVSLDTARTPTCRCNSAMAARTQFGTPGTAAASAARTPTEHSCIRNSAVAARTYFGTPPKAGQPVQQGLSAGEQPVQQAGPNMGAGQPAQQHMPKNMGCPPGMSPQQQQPAPYSLLAGAETASGQQQPPLGSSLPADSQTHGSTNSPTNMGGGVNTAMAKAGGNMHSPADGSTPMFGGVPPHPPADQQHGMVNQNEQPGEPSHGSPPERRPAEPHTPARTSGQLEFIIIYYVFVYSPHLCVGFLILILYPAPASSSATPAFIHTQLCHTLSFTHNFVTHHLSHTTLSQTIFHPHVTSLSHTIFRTQLCHTPSFTHHFVTHHLSPHHLSPTSLSHTIFHHTIFHPHLCHTQSFAHTIFHTQLGHTPFFTTPSFTPIFVTHHLSHTTLCHTPSFTTPSFTHIFVTHHLSPHHLSPTSLSHTQSFAHTIFHTQLGHTPFFTTPSFTHNLAHHLSHTIFAWQA